MKNSSTIDSTIPDYQRISLQKLTKKSFQNEITQENISDDNANDNFESFKDIIMNENNLELPLNQKFTNEIELKPEVKPNFISFISEATTTQSMQLGLREIEKPETKIKDLFDSVDYIYLSKFDLTNRLLDVLSESSKIVLSLWVLTIFCDICVRFNTYFYLFYFLAWDSKYLYYYLALIAGSRVVYILITIKLMFQNEFEDIYIERVAKTITYIFENDKKTKNTNDKNFEYNLNFQSKTTKIISLKNINENFNFNFFWGKIIFVLLPNEISFFILKPFFKDNLYCVIIYILLNWLFKSAELFFQISILSILYFKEEIEQGINYYSINLIVILADICKCLILILILFIFNKKYSNSELLINLSKKYDVRRF